MGSLDGTIKIQREEYRPCLVDGKEALFHRWVEEQAPVLIFNEMLRPAERARLSKEFCRTRCLPSANADIKAYTTVNGIVEFDDGTIKKVDPEQITFIDGLVHSEHVSEYRKCYEEYWNKQKEKENEND